MYIVHRTARWRRRTHARRHERNIVTTTRRGFLHVGCYIVIIAWRPFCVYSNEREKHFSRLTPFLVPPSLALQLFRLFSFLFLSLNEGRPREHVACAPPAAEHILIIIFRGSTTRTQNNACVEGITGG